MLLAVLRCDRELRFQNMFLRSSRPSCIRWSALCKKSSRTATRVLRARPEMTSEPRNSLNRFPGKKSAELALFGIYW